MTRHQPLPPGLESTMESRRNALVGHVSTSYNLKDSRAPFKKLCTTSSPISVYQYVPYHEIDSSNGLLWIAFTGTDKQVQLGFRQTTTFSDPSRYVLFDLSEHFPLADSDDSPALCSFNKSLLISWKRQNKIMYQRTDCRTETPGAGLQWAFKTPQELPHPHHASSAPVLFSSYGRLCLVWLGGEDEGKSSVWCTTSYDSRNWTEPTVLETPDGECISCTYLPSFSQYKDSWWIFYGSANQEVYYSKISPDFKLSIPEAVDEGKWRTEIGSSHASGCGQWWLFTTDSDGKLSVATGNTFTRRSILRPDDITTTKRCAATMIPGVPGCPKKPWRIFVIWVDETDKLLECIMDF